MKSLHLNRVWLAPLVVLSVFFPVLVRAQVKASCELANSTLGCETGGSGCPTPSGGTPLDTNTQCLEGTRRMALIIRFETPNKKQGSVVLPGNSNADLSEVQELSCETGEIIAKRTLDEICNGIGDGIGAGQPGPTNGYPALVKIPSTMCLKLDTGTSGSEHPFCSGAPSGTTCCDAKPLPFPGPPSNLTETVTLSVRQNIDPQLEGCVPLQGNDDCAFDVSYDPSDVNFPNFSVAPNGNCKVGGVQFASTAGNSPQADLLDRYLIQVNPNGITGPRIRTIRTAIV